MSLGLSVGRKLDMARGLFYCAIAGVVAGGAALGFDTLSSRWVESNTAWRRARDNCMGP